MDTAGGYEPPRPQSQDEKIAEWEAQAAAMLGLDNANDQLFFELRNIFSAQNFTDSDGQKALNDIQRLKDEKREAQSIIYFLKDKFKYQHNI